MGLTTNSVLIKYMYNLKEMIPIQKVAANVSFEKSFVIVQLGTTVLKHTNRYSEYIMQVLNETISVDIGYDLHMFNK